MSNCWKCGSSYNPGELFCGSCGASLKSTRTNSQSTGCSSNYQSIYSSYPLADNFVKLSESEVKVKTYHCAALKKPKGEGYVTVTNKRVVFHGHGGSSRIFIEVPIETISGIRAYLGTGIEIPSLIFGIVSSLISLELASKSKWIAFLVFLVLGIFFCMKCWQSSYCLAIFSNGANSSPINIGDSSFKSKLTGQGAIMTLGATPSTDTLLLMQEIGAIVIDFKTMGDQAISKWAPDMAQKVKSNSLEGEI